jgi:hypothetical protein
MAGWLSRQLHKIEVEAGGSSRKTYILRHRFEASWKRSLGIINRFDLLPWAIMIIVIQPHLVYTSFHLIICYLKKMEYTRKHGKPHSKPICFPSENTWNVSLKCLGTSHGCLFS